MIEVAHITRISSLQGCRKYKNVLSLNELPNLPRDTDFSNESLLL